MVHSPKGFRNNDNRQIRLFNGLKNMLYGKKAKNQYITPFAMNDNLPDKGISRRFHYKHLFLFTHSTAQLKIDKLGEQLRIRPGSPAFFKRELQQFGSPCPNGVTGILFCPIEKLLRLNPAGHSRSGISVSAEPYSQFQRENLYTVKAHLQVRCAPTFMELIVSIQLREQTMKHRYFSAFHQFQFNVRQLEIKYFVMESDVAFF